MSAIQLIASFITSGKLHGVGIGFTISEVHQAFQCDFIDVADNEGQSLRRDYGFVEFYFNPGTEWVVTGGSLELHKLASNYALAERWHKNIHVAFPQYVSWDEVQEALSRMPDFPAFHSTDQGGFIEYRFPDTKVSALASDDHEDRDEWVGHADVWSISLG
ncbi:hypothetical protein ACWCXB_02970 [Streptomyces sp. NPDC001514]